MLIQLQTVPEDHPLSVSFAISAAAMNETGSLSAFPLLFEQSVQCDLKLRKIHEDIWVQAVLSGHATPNCDRCLTPFALDIGQENQFCCQWQGLGQATEEDGDLYFFQGSEIDMVPILRERVFLSLPMKFICDENCAGLCLRCGDVLSPASACRNCQKNTKIPQKTLQL